MLSLAYCIIAQGNPMSYQNEPSSQDQSVIPEDAKSTQCFPICPNCGYPVREGELACNNCGIVFSASGRTKTITDFKPEDLKRVRSVGEALVHEACAITLNIGSETMVLPNAESVVLGRDTMIASGPQRVADLSPYGAHVCGVSHLHLKVMRKNNMIYVADLGSTNGTFLNGVRLMPKQERVLRNGDELILGRLCARVKFNQ